jgi:hypothetical protein
MVHDDGTIDGAIPGPVFVVGHLATPGWLAVLAGPLLGSRGVLENTSGWNAAGKLLDPSLLGSSGSATIIRLHKSFASQEDDDAAPTSTTPATLPTAARASSNSPLFRSCGAPPLGTFTPRSVALGAELRAAGRPSEAKKWEKETHKRDKRMHAYRFFFGDAATRLGHEMPLRLGRLSVGGASTGGAQGSGGGFTGGARRIIGLSEAKALQLDRALHSAGTTSGRSTAKRRNSGNRG